ncbi:MAG: AraC family transcriptional regulator [Tyzzerella sp.]|nr:AraC family transcriptional regulator [Tyzzerella sp.]MBQ4559643.1 AraC family transcriptional regulator [Tyzzerella sp.]
MKEYNIFKTGTGTKQFPLHQHDYWDIMYYLSGTGHMATANEKIPFKPGDIIIVPPQMLHGSVSKDAFINISIGGKFDHIFMTKEILVLHDNPSLDGQRLSELIYENRYCDNEYLSALCNAYVHYLLQNSMHENKVHRAIQEIISQVADNYFEPDFEITPCLHKSGFAEDYIRAEFKKVTSLSPIEFLTKTRLEHAAKLLEIYGHTLSVAEIGLACGFDDAIYFSRRFKQFMKVSPNEYRKQHFTK